jgi:hypothetical protein
VNKSYNNEGNMRNKKGAWVAVAAPAIITPAVLFLPNASGRVFGLSMQFWAGFLIGLVIVLAVAGLARSLKK